MNKITLGLSAAALAIAAAAGTGAYAAQEHGGHHGRAMHGMMADPFGDATITRADAQAKATAMFDKMDVNHDGKLDGADRTARISEHFDKMDANRDGTLSRQEFIAAHEQAMKDHAGADGDRGPRHEGMGHEGMGPEGMGHKGMGREGMRPNGPMAGMDGNGDRTITRAEFLAGAMKHFDAADANHDGKLTKEERRAAHQAHRREMREGMGKMGAMPGMNDDPADGSDHH